MQIFFTNSNIFGVQGRLNNLHKISCNITITLPISHRFKLIITITLNLYLCNYSQETVSAFDLFLPLIFAFRLPVVILPVRLLKGQKNS